MSIKLTGYPSNNMGIFIGKEVIDGFEVLSRKKLLADVTGAFYSEEVR